jgi:hypothetical protein
MNTTSLDPPPGLPLAEAGPRSETPSPPATATAVAKPGRRNWIARVYRAGDFAWEWVFGLASLIVGLAVVATLPVVQLLSLGYLLEAGGRVARTGRLRDGIVGARKAARLGGAVLGARLVLVPLQIAVGFRTDAQLIAPGSPAAVGWSVAVALLTVLSVLWIAAACWRGGRMRHFLWPRPLRFLLDVRKRGSYRQARDAVSRFVAELRLPHYFSLGFRGFVGGLIWLAIPATLLAFGANAPWAALLGALLLAWALFYVPFVQIRMAAENRFSAIFEARAVRRAYARAPLAFVFALAVTLLFALPLYLLKIELVPREAAWLPSLLFVVFIFPARLLCGWAVARGQRRLRSRHWVFRILGRTIVLPVVALYVLIVSISPILSWHGLLSLYEQHALLVPVPFLGL